MVNRVTDDHGSCVHCGFDLNGERIYDYFLNEYDDPDMAKKYAAIYGATKEQGRFGKEIYVKSYGEDYSKLPSYFKCPECGEKCYQEKEDGS